MLKRYFLLSYILLFAAALVAAVSSGEEITDKFGRCFPDVSYYQIDFLQETIRASHCKRKNKEAMYKLVELLKTVQSVDKALEKLEAKGYDTSGILKNFEKLGVSPVHLRKDFCAERLPGLVELLCPVWWNC